MLLNLATLIAQNTGASPAPGGTPPGNPSPMPMLIGLGLMVAVFYFVLIRGNRKQQKQRQNLLANLSKNDKVMTIGGIVGTVVNVKENEVVVKVDESNNTKMTFLKKAIQQVITDTDQASLDSR